MVLDLGFLGFTLPKTSAEPRKGATKTTVLGKVRQIIRLHVSLRLEAVLRAWYVRNIGFHRFPVPYQGVTKLLV